MSQAISSARLAAQDSNQAFPAQAQRGPARPSTAQHSPPAFVSICSILTQLHRLNLPYVAVWEHKVMQLVWQNKSRHIGLCSFQSMANVEGVGGREKSGLTEPRTKQVGSTGFGAAGPAGSNILFTWTGQQKWAHGCCRYFLHNWPSPVHTRGLKV